MNARAVVKYASSLADRLVHPPAGVTVLIHHRVGGGSGSEVDLDPADFERQLEHLAEHHRRKNNPVNRNCTVRYFIKTLQDTIPGS